MFVPFPEPGAPPNHMISLGRTGSPLFFSSSAFQISSKIVDALTLIISTFEVDMDRNIIVDLDPHTLLLFNKNRLVDFTTYDDNIFNEGKDFVKFTLRS